MYEDDSSYFSFLHLLGRSKRRYTVSSHKEKRRSYRRYHHIAESRNSAVIPVKISKRSSTASVRPSVVKRSRSVESVSSGSPDFMDALLEENRSYSNRFSSSALRHFSEQTFVSFCKSVIK